MSLAKPIWTGSDLYVRIYTSDSSGQKLGGVDAVPLLDFCFVESAGVNGQGRVELRDRECQDSRELVTVGNWDDYTLAVDSLYVSKADEYLKDTIFSAGYWLYIELLCAGYLTGSSKADDLHVFTKAKGTSFSISGRDNDNVIFNCAFRGTEFS